MQPATILERIRSPLAMAIYRKGQLRLGWYIKIFAPFLVIFQLVSVGAVKVLSSC